MDPKPPVPSQAVDDDKPADAPVVAVDQTTDTDHDALVSADSPAGGSVEDAMKQVSDLFNNAPPEEVDKMVASEAPAASGDSAVDSVGVTDSSVHNDPRDPLAGLDVSEPVDPVPADSVASVIEDVESTPDTTSEAAASEVPTAPAFQVADPVMPAADVSIPPAAPVPGSPSMGAGAPDIMAQSVPMAAPVIGGVAATGVQKRKPKWFMKAVIAGGAVLVLGGGSAAAYYGYVVPNKPENILKTALFNSMSDKAKSAYVDGDFKITSKQQDFSLGGTITGKADEKAFDISLEMDAVVAKLKFDARSVDGKTYYLRLGGLSGLPELLSASGVDPSISKFLTKLDNQWLEINESLIKGLGVNTSSSLSQTDLKKLADIYQRHDFVKVKTTLPAEIVKGASNYHYSVVVDKTELKAAYTEIKNANLKSFPITQKELDQLNTALKDVNLDKYPFDVWVDKKTKMIDQIGITVDDASVKFELKLAIFDYNKPVSVEKPQGAKSILEVVSQFYTSLGINPGGAAGGSQDTLLKQLQGNGISL